MATTCSPLLLAMASAAGSPLTWRHTSLTNCCDSENSAKAQAEMETETETETDNKKPCRSCGSGHAQLHLMNKSMRNNMNAVKNAHSHLIVSDILESENSPTGGYC